MAVKTLVGMLFMVGFLLLAGLTFMVEDLNELFEKGYILRVRLKEAPLEKGDPVTLAGKKIGKIKTIEVDETSEMPVEVVARIEEGNKVYDTYVARIWKDALIGSAQLAISIHFEDGESKLLQDGDLMEHTEETVDFGSIMAKANVVMAKAKVIAGNVEEMTGKIREGEGTVGKLVMTDELYEEVRAGVKSFDTTFDNAATITATINDGKGAVGRLINDDDLGQRVDSSVTEFRGTFSNANELVKGVREGKGTVGRLMQDEEMSADAKTLVANAKKAFAGIDDVTRDIKQGKGTLGRLAKDEALADSIGQAIQEFKKTGKNLVDITDKVKKGEGTVGKLIYDEKLINTAQNILDSVQAALEDLRESAPVASFAGAVLGAF